MADATLGAASLTGLITMLNAVAANGSSDVYELPAGHYWFEATITGTATLTLYASNSGTPANSIKVWTASGFVELDVPQSGRVMGTVSSFSSGTVTLTAL